MRNLYVSHGHEEKCLYDEKDQGQNHDHILSKSSPTSVEEISARGKEREGEKGQAAPAE